MHGHFLNSTGRHEYFFKLTGPQYAFLNSTCKKGTHPSRAPQLAMRDLHSVQCKKKKVCYRFQFSILILINDGIGELSIKLFRLGTGPVRL